MQIQDLPSDCPDRAMRKGYAGSTSTCILLAVWQSAPAPTTPLRSAMSQPEWRAAPQGRRHLKLIRDCLRPPSRGATSRFGTLTRACNGTEEVRDHHHRLLSQEHSLQHASNFTVSAVSWSSPSRRIWTSASSKPQSRKGSEMPASVTGARAVSLQCPYSQAWAGSLSSMRRVAAKLILQRRDFAVYSTLASPKSCAASNFEEADCKVKVLLRTTGRVLCLLTCPPPIVVTILLNHQNSCMAPGNHQPQQETQLWACSWLLTPCQPQHGPCYKPARLLHGYAVLAGPSIDERSEWSEHEACENSANTPSRSRPNFWRNPFACGSRLPSTTITGAMVRIFAGGHGASWQGQPPSPRVTAQMLNAEEGPCSQAICNRLA